MLYEYKTSYLLYLKLTQADFSEVSAAFFSDPTDPPATRLSDTEQSEEVVEEVVEERTAPEVRKNRGLEEETETETAGGDGEGGAEKKRANPPQSVTPLEEGRPQWEAGRKEPVGGEEEERAEERAREREQQGSPWGGGMEAAVGGEDVESALGAEGTNQLHEWHDENEAFLNHVASMQRNFSEYYTDDDCGVQIMGGKVKLALLVQNYLLY